MSTPIHCHHQFGKVASSAEVPTICGHDADVLSALTTAELVTDHGLLAGTHLFYAYSQLLDASWPAAVYETSDFDIILLQFGLHRLNGTSLIRQLADVGLLTTPTENAARISGLPTSLRTSAGLKLDFLTAESAVGDFCDLSPFRMPRLDFLMEKTIFAPITTATQLHLVRVPDPARYAVHKLAMSLHRIGATAHKEPRDLWQADLVFRCLLERQPGAIRSALTSARRYGLAFFGDVDTQLKKLPFQTVQEVLATLRGATTSPATGQRQPRRDSNRT